MSYSAFFYGTLMHPAILRRVIGHEGSQLEICPAVLLEHTRHKIQRADYPGVVPYSQSQALFRSSGRGDLAPAERTVRGTFVQGLNERDVALLDLFEGDEYVRETVAVHPLGPLTPLASTADHRAPVSSAPGSKSDGVASAGADADAATDAYVVPRTAPELPPLDTLAPAVPAQTYIYAGGLRRLSPELWSYEDFVRESAWKWVGAGSGSGAAVENEEYYAEVDRRRELDGKTLRTAIVDGPGGAGSGAGADVGDGGKTVVTLVSGRA
ncbi:hypothetical protein C8Q77DRAFT_1099974 [Trametes polyzona]|nr:hypothetical protein C8Q77DRAFT_1099974 [Trametes polyzona]